MKKNTFKRAAYAPYLISALLLTSCVNNVNDELQTGNILISFSTQVSKSTTKASQSTFEAGDRMGIFAMLSGTSVDGQRYIDNVRLEYGTNGTLTPQKELFYPEGDVTLDFISYYPYQDGGVATGSPRLDISVQTEQNKTENYSLSDFMTARSESIPNTEETVKLKYKHRLAKIKITLVPQGGETANDLVVANPRIVATGFKTQAQYDLQTDKISQIMEKSETDILLSGTWKAGNGVVSGKEFIVIPQTHSNSTQAFTLEWDGKIYACSLSAATIKEDTELEIRIDALQSTSKTLSGIVTGIKEWGAGEIGTGENSYNITAIHTASFSFRTSDVYRIYRQGRAVAEVCREYLNSTTGNEISSRAIVVYPVHARNGKEQTDLTNGIVLQLPDKEAAIHGGKVNWSTADNSLAYTAGNSEVIEKFYIDENENIVLEEPATAFPVNISNYVIRDMRNAVVTNYPIVKIGTQYWIKEDLQATAYNDGKYIPLKKDLGQGAAYFEWTANGTRLYSGEAILTGKVAPEEWKLPTKDDWNRLKNYVGENASALKKADMWDTTGNQATDETGFSSIPRGLLLERENKTTLINPASSVAYWVYDDAQKRLEEVVIIAKSDNLIAFKNAVKPEGKDYYNAFSIRCIKE